MSGVFLTQSSAQAVRALRILRPSTLLRSVSRLNFHEFDCGNSAAAASAFPNPYTVIDALLGSLRLTSSFPSFSMPGVAPVGRLPHGRVVELSNRGSTYVVDSGPTAGGPTFVMLHALACTGLLTWYPSLEMMRRFGRVVVFDQRWHGAGIDSPRFLLEDCADDVAALADELGIETFIPVGFSMGSLVAQQVWRRHRDRVDALVLCAAAASFRRAAHERLSTGVSAALVDAFGPQPGRPGAVPLPVADDAVTNDRLWAAAQLRSTSYGAMLGALAEITRFDSTRWIADIDVPTSVLIPLRDRVIPPRHQRWLAHQIPDAHTVTVDAGHTSCTLQSDAFVPGLRSAVDSVVQRITQSRNATAGVPA
ncbi:alpha/beta fold hydrolase [Mycobacterium sp.]|uniref:alpha/beta fold hydrolase n=1 Tax=Mycobacterium sp. TaxID=1785 RepID=UPI002DAA0174|nr:alpha/beta hydrolase [Mycobacterium sp.]